MIGTFGPITFVVSEKEVRTFQELTRRESARWAKHEIVGKRTKSEFLGPDNGSISFKIKFDVMYGLNPRKELNTLIAIIQTGEVHKLILGGKAMGAYKYYISDMTQNWENVDNEGRLLVASVTVNLEEYV